MFPVDGSEPHLVLRSAETALRRAKAAGNNSVCFFAPDMLDRMHPQLNIETELKRALENEELRLHFQPQMDLATGALRGMEGLVRWQHPARGLLLPGEFIPMAEENHALIRAISDWTLDATCAQLAAWQTAGLDPVTLAVNFTPVQLRDNGMVARLDQLLERYGVQGSRMELEITENLLMAEPRAAEILIELRSRGLRIAVDDFGTGYSSLAYLKDLPIDRAQDRPRLRARRAGLPEVCVDHPRHHRHRPPPGLRDHRRGRGKTAPGRVAARPGMHGVSRLLLLRCRSRRGRARASLPLRTATASIGQWPDRYPAERAARSGRRHAGRPAGPCARRPDRQGARPEDCATSAG